MKRVKNLGITLLVSTAICLTTPSILLAQSASWDEFVIDRSQRTKLPGGRLEGQELKALVDLGEKLFSGKFTSADGAGRPMATQAIIPTKKRHLARSSIQRLPGPDASACSSCHNEPVMGGAGDITANVFVSEGFTNADFDTTDPQFSNERNTNHLMGSGLVELIAREMTRDLIELRKSALQKARSTKKPVQINLTTKSVNFGALTAYPDGLVDLSQIEGVDTDLNIRPFGQKGVFTSLRQFTVNAMNHHHGMQAVERFGSRWTGEVDFDEDGVTEELVETEVSALVAWQANLPSPTRLKPEDGQWAEHARLGEKLFTKIGCSDCHIPALPLENSVFTDPGPFDTAGTHRQGESAVSYAYDFNQHDWFRALPLNSEGHVLVPLYSDLKRHKISDQKYNHFGNELLAQRFVERDQFQTTELWGLGSTAPYGHRGDLTTINEAIKAHGGEASQVSEAYRGLSRDEKRSIIAFLKTLVIGK